MLFDNRTHRYLRLHFFCWMPEPIIVLFVCSAGWKIKYYIQIWKPDAKSDGKISHIEKYGPRFCPFLKLNIKQSIADCHVKRWTQLYYLISHIFPVPKRRSLRHLDTSAGLLIGWPEVTQHTMFWVSGKPLGRYLEYIHQSNSHWDLKLLQGAQIM